MHIKNSLNKFVPALFRILVVDNIKQSFNIEKKYKILMTIESHYFKVMLSLTGIVLSLMYTYMYIYLSIH